MDFVVLFLAAVLFLVGLVRLYRLTLSEDELLDELMGGPDA